MELKTAEWEGKTDRQRGRKERKKERTEGIQRERAREKNLITL